METQTGSKKAALNTITSLADARAKRGMPPAGKLASHRSPRKIYPLSPQEKEEFIEMILNLSPQQEKYMRRLAIRMLTEQISSEAKSV